MVLVQGNKVLKLVKSLYWLKEVSIQWHEKFDNEIMSNEFRFNATSVMWNILQEAMLLWDMIQEMKISNTSNGLVLS